MSLASSMHCSLSFCGIPEAFHGRKVNTPSPLSEKEYEIQDFADKRRFPAILKAAGKEEIVEYDTHCNL